MSDLTLEQFEQLPDFVQSDYQEVDGVYKHAGMVKLKTSLNEVDTKYKGQLGELNERLSSFEETKKAEIEAAKTEALANAKSKGEVDKIEAHYEELLRDAETRSYEKGRAEAASEFKLQSAKQQAATLAIKIAAKLAINSDAQQDLEDLISLRVKPDESGNITFYNRDGSASTMTESEFEAEVKARHKRLVKGETTTQGGGLTNGSRNGSASKEPKKYTEAERLALKVSDPARFNKLFKHNIKVI